MVDFNAEATVSASAIDILRILILQRRNDVIDSFEQYRKVENHSHPDTGIVRARMISLFMEIQAMLKRKIRDYDALVKKVLSEDFDDLEDAFFKINEFLDHNRLIRIDNRKIYDSTRAASEDREKGL
jgi:predicted SAM-dependent methyltransferase